MIDSLILGYKEKIEINPFILSGFLYPLVDNNYDSFREDRSATPETKDYTNPVRITTKKKAIKKTKDENTPIVYEDVFLMVSDNETVIDERLEFNYLNNKLKVIKRIPKMRYNTIIGYEYELKDITEESVYAA